MGPGGDPSGRQETRAVGAPEGKHRVRRRSARDGAARGARGDRRPGRLVEKLGDVRYTYTWAGERIFKIVSFFLLRYASGRLGDLPSETAHEVDEVRWLPLDEAPKLLAYGGERQMAEKALAFVRNGAV